MLISESLLLCAVHAEVVGLGPTQLVFEESTMAGQEKINGENPEVYFAACSAGHPKHPDGRCTPHKFSIEFFPFGSKLFPGEPVVLLNDGFNIVDFSPSWSKSSAIELIRRLTNLPCGGSIEPSDVIELEKKLDTWDMPQEATLSDKLYAAHCVTLKNHRAICAKIKSLELSLGGMAESFDGIKQLIANAQAATEQQISVLQASNDNLTTKNAQLEDELRRVRTANELAHQANRELRAQLGAHTEIEGCRSWNE